MIKIRNLTKTYVNGDCRTEALRGINLDIEKGDFVAIMGKSGSGKSTLMNIMGAMDSLTGGEYLYGDIKVHELSISELHKFRAEHVSFVFQNFALMKYYTVYENIEMPLLAKGIAKKERKHITEEKMQQVGISELSKKLVTNISGGQQARCAIARALASGNELILADEPTGALDSKTSAEIMDIFEELNNNGITICVVTHDNTVAQRCKRIIYIEDGLIK